MILFKNHFLIILALSLFVFNESLIIFSSQVKQYICDVMVINMILYFCLKDFSKIEKRFLVLAIVGVVSIYISNASIVILFCAGLYLFVDFAILSRIFISRVLVTILIWSVAFGIYYFLFINGHESINQQQSNYTERRGFVAQNIFSYEFYYLLYKKSYMIFTQLLIKNSILPFLFIIGLIAVWIKKKAFLLLAFLPILIHLVISSFKLYPYELRFILYLIPCLIIVISFGLEFLLSKFKFTVNPYFSLAIPLFYCLLFFRKSFPFKVDEVISSINYIQKEIKVDEKVFVYHSAIRTFQYYQDIGLVKKRYSITKGCCYFRFEKAKYIDELLTLKGKYWILFGHAHEGEIHYILDELENRQIQAINTFIDRGSCAFLFDFKAL